MQTAPRVVLSTGMPARPSDSPAPARLVVSLDLGLGFRALDPVSQRDAIEGGLSDALVVAFAKLDEVNSPSPEVAA